MNFIVNGSPGSDPAMRHRGVCCAGSRRICKGMTKLSRTVAMALLAIIIFATLSPIQMRPHIAEANIERALAYVLLGFALALGFPNRLYQAVVFVAVTAGVLELLQIIDPGRHAHIADALVKACAGIVGILVGQLFVRSSGRLGER
ncbi:VanZ family protein [Mesorhizobium cantuariense]|uniref:VanZ family protein n=1 Tax=Mesorhizobium cantuariense TaxID=1300275 RepID=A0ABV7MM31_9HYPH